MPLNEIIATTSIVQIVKAGSVIGSATSFFYTRQDHLFLVTNRHVVRDDSTGHMPDTLRLRLHRNPNNPYDNGDWDVSLYVAGSQLWKTPPAHPDADVALIRLDRRAITTSFFIRAWSSAQFLPSNYRLDPGEDVFVIGYPLGFYDEIHNLPVFRNAMIASAYSVPFRGQPIFLTDANLHAGTSGSPVITKPKSAWVDNEGNTNLITGMVYYLVGVHSGTVAPQVTGGIPVGLGAAWYAALIEDTAASF